MNDPRSVVILGEDGLSRCAWSGTDEEYRRYHDEEWGVELHGDRSLFEKLSLEAFQAGLSWITILRRRNNFRTAFHNFDMDRVACFAEPEIERLLHDSGIIRNRAKIEATISNAGIVQQLVQDDVGAFDRLMWSYAPRQAARRRPANFADIPAVTVESTALSTALRSIGLRFVGPTTMYALMQSSGMVDDHVEGCWRAA